MREQKIFLDMDMKKFENTLDNFFGSWVNDKNSRFLSWEHCYNFFKDSAKKSNKAIMILLFKIANIKIQLY